MKLYFLEIPTALVHEDERYPDRDNRHIYEHLKHTLSRVNSFLLPAITVDLLDGTLVATGGHKYLRIARDLGRPKVRAVFQTELSDPADVLGQLPASICITPREVLEREEKMPTVRDYHVYFFENPLSSEAQQQFLFEIAGFFERLETPVISRSDKRLFQWAFPFEGRCAEFEALIPLGDRSWLEAYLQRCQAFSRNVQRIISFQGARFPE